MDVGRRVPSKEPTPDKRGASVTTRIQAPPAVVRRPGSAILAGLVVTANSARALVLATDGASDCNTALNASTCRCVGGGSGAGRGCGSGDRCLDDTRTVKVISSYETKGLPTYVVGIQSARGAPESEGVGPGAGLIAPTFIDGWRTECRRRAVSAGSRSAT